MSDINSDYESQAADYDSFIRKLIPGYDFFMTITPVLVGSPATLLDLGCGTGNISAAIQRIHKNTKITCVDPSENMLEIAKTKITAEFIKSNIEDFTTTKKYDAITSIMVMHNVQTIEERFKAYKMIYETLNNGGIYITADILYGENDITQDIYMKMWREYMLGSLPPEEVDGKWLLLHKEKDKPIRVSKQTAMLYDAGFHSIDIINKNINFALMAAYK